MRGLRRLLGHQDRKLTMRPASLANLRPFCKGWDPRRNLTTGPKPHANLGNATQQLKHAIMVYARQQGTGRVLDKLSELLEVLAEERE